MWIVKTTVTVAVALILLFSVTSCAAGTAVTTSTNPTLDTSQTFNVGDVIPAVRYPVPDTEISSRYPPQAPDDLMTAPGGYVYAANFHQQGQPDKWPEITMSHIVLDGVGGTLNITWRASMEVKVGETRYNLISANYQDPYGKADMEQGELMLYYAELPPGISLGVHGAGGIPGTVKTVLAIIASPDAPTGTLALKIFLQYNGLFYSTLPITVNVVK